MPRTDVESVPTNYQFPGLELLQETESMNGETFKHQLLQEARTLEEKLARVKDFINNNVEKKLSDLVIQILDANQDVEKHKNIIVELDALCRKDPSTFWYTYHWIPVEQWCPSSVDEMSKLVR